MKDWLKVGVITSTHGIRGEVKVFPTTDDMNRFKKLNECILITKNENMILHIESCKFFKNMVILKFEEFNNINDIEMYKQCELYVTRENAVDLYEDEYFIGDILGSKIVDENGETIGILDDILATGANDVYVIQTEEGKEILMPAIKQCILDVNIEEKIITVHLLEGMVN